MLTGCGSRPTTTPQIAKTDQRMAENNATHISSPNGQAATKNSIAPKSLPAGSPPWSLLASIPAS
jgi:hypothetical protein